MRPHFILYVADQARSSSFYSRVLGLKPRLDVPGMTEFQLGPESVLGLMPEAVASRLLGAAYVDVGSVGSTARAELYLIVDSPSEYHRRALSAGAREISPMAERDWGHNAAYSLDPDNHVLAFAEVAAD
jgi:catechol 2,3-dioxygenase-like lactoylglutathione lyase family enzyme